MYGKEAFESENRPLSPRSHSRFTRKLTLTSETPCFAGYRIVKTAIQAIFTCSQRKQGFDSPTGHQKTEKHTDECFSVFFALNEKQGNRRKRK